MTGIKISPTNEMRGSYALQGDVRPGAGVFASAVVWDDRIRHQSESGVT